MRAISRVKLHVLVSTMLLSVSLAAQQGAASGPPLAVVTTELPKAYLRQLYRLQLQAQGGIAPFKWEVTEGNLPPGITLSADGVLIGVPTAVGEYHFTVTVTDSGRPAVQRAQPLTLRVVSPLLLEWGRYAAVHGQRIEGSVKVSNDTDLDFDLTVVIVAVNDYGRATALGYQRLSLKRNAAELEIAFGENLPFGSYEVNVDAIAEVPSTNAIHRARLVTNERLQIQQGP